MVVLALAALPRCGRLPANSTQSGSLSTPCAERPGCTVGARWNVEGVRDGALVRADLSSASNAQSDAESCRRREYWLLRPGGDVLLAADCEAQWGADSQGPAEVRLTGPRLQVRYVEFQADDRCETLEAVIDLVSLRIGRQERSTGVVQSDRCQVTGRLDVHPEPGDGSLKRPLLSLHRD